MKKSKATLLEIQGTDPRWLSRSQLSWLSGEQLSWLSRSQLSWLSGEQLSGLSGEQLSWLSRSQLSGLSGEQLSWLSRSQLSWLSGEQLSGLSRSQLSWLSREQLEVIGLLKDVPILEQPYTKIHAAIKSGGLEMNTWHSCETVHCVGGWTCVLAPGGKDFERKLGNTALAAELILRASRPDAPLPLFTATNEAAMAFIEARVAEEK